ncbi:MAG: MFS transporter [Bacteroidales bacterium]|nr:MFS transporter [Bacteroidales bacterium]MCM1415653.1 MFS transporter [bacterium]MCM1422973.1 MFS transporter [bacterium]
MKKNYKKTLTACYLGFITQAITANFAPLLFLKFHTDYQIPLGRIALISTIFFLTQLVVDVLCSYFADRIGYRRCVVASELCAAAGLIGLAFLPELFPNPLAGILASVIVYAIGSGLIEVLCSPIVEACPFDHKEAVMSLLHSFYCWGSVGVILLSTAFFAVFGIDRWKWLACIWALIPLYNLYNFATCPIEMITEDGKGMKTGSLLRIPIFWIAIILMVCAGASELSMSQWASAYAESALGLTKTVGDLAGPCLFAVTMGISRVIFGKFGDRLDLMKFMIGSGALCLLCYLAASVSNNPLLGLIGCILCGFSVGIMWPGTISICSGRLPGGGTAMFALLAMAGDLGGSFGPTLVGNITQHAGNDLRKGMMVGCVFPLVLILSLLLLKNAAPLRKDTPR